MTVFGHPREFKEVRRLRYDPATDVMVLGGTTDEHANQHWKPMGPVLARHDTWSGPNRALRWKMAAPCQKEAGGHHSCGPMGFDIAGEYLGFLEEDSKAKILLCRWKP
jgi:hypothetical protein